MNVHREVSTPGYHLIHIDPLKQLSRTQSTVAFSGRRMSEERQARRGSDPIEQTRDFHDHEASPQTTDRAHVTATRHPNSVPSLPADLNGFDNDTAPLNLIATHDYPRTVTLSSSFSSSPGSSAGEARQSVRGAAVDLEPPPVMAPMPINEMPRNQQTEPRTCPAVVNVRDINNLLRSYRRQRGSTIMDEEPHATWDDGQAEPERACSDTRAVAGSDSLEWETRHAEEAD